MMIPLCKVNKINYLKHTQKDFYGNRRWWVCGGLYNINIFIVDIAYSDGKANRFRLRYGTLAQHS